MALGFILIKAASNYEHKVYNQLSQISEIVKLHPGSGEYDLIAQVESESYANLKIIAEEKVKSIESIGKRLNDDMDEEEYYESPLVPFKFLINNGFILKKNDPLFPLLRLDLKSIAISFAESRIMLGKMALKKEVESPMIIKDE